MTSIKHTSEKTVVFGVTEVMVKKFMEHILDHLDTNISILNQISN